MAPGKILDITFAWVVKFHLLCRCLESAEGARVIQKYEEMMQLLDRCVCILSHYITPCVIMLRCMYY